MQQERVNEIIGLVLFAFSIFLLISFVTYQVDDISFYTSEPARPVNNAAGLLGANIAFGVFYTFGACGFLFPIVFIFWAVCMFLQKVPERLLPKMAGFFVMQLSISCIAALVSPMADKIAAGGIVGYVTSDFLSNYLGFSGTLIYSVFCLLVSFLLATEFLLYEVFVFLSENFTTLFDAVRDFIENLRGGEVSKKEGVSSKKKAKKLKKDTKEPKPALNRDIEVKIKKYEDQIKALNKSPKSKKKANEKTDESGVVTLDEKELRGVEKAMKGSIKDVVDEEPEEEDIEYEYEEVEEDEYEDEEVAEGEEEEEEDEDEEEDDDEEEGEEDLDEEDEELEDAEDGDEEEEEEEGDESELPQEVVTGAVEEEKSEFQFVSIGAFEGADNFQLPSTNLLADPILNKGMSEDLMANSRMIEKRLLDFDIDVKVTEVEQGPVITRYEILPAPGIKLSRIINLQDDIALTMKTSSIRIAPVAGKNTVGIEIPNSVSNMVFLKELIEDVSVNPDKFALPLYLGKNTSGKPLVTDLAEMPHILIAGTTGSGKTFALNAVITGLLSRMTPSQLRLVMVDPKMVEMSTYNDIPHLAAPVVTDAKKAASVLNWVVAEMENRYRLLASVGVRNIKGFNDRTKSQEERDQRIPDLLPYIVVVVDELADLMLIAADKVESTITRLAQLSRAVGIHLILATQRPSVDVITGVIKANFPARVSFKVASKIDSRTVLDVIGADKLLGKGDMLFLEPGEAKPIRAQSAFISDNEIKDITKYLKSQSKVKYLKALEDITAGKISPAMLEKDEMYDEAVRTILDTGQASVSVLQRRLRLGYARAARIIDMMEAEGIVGPYQGSKPRDILVSRDRV